MPMQRCMQRPTTTSGPTPSARSSRGEPIRQQVELAVAHAARAERSATASGVARAWARKSACTGRSRATAGEPVVPVDQHPVPLGGIHQRQAIQRAIGIGDDAAQQMDEMRRQPGDGLRLEQVGAVLEQGLEPGAGLDHRQRKVELGSPGMDADLLARESVEFEQAMGKVVERERDLVERIPAGIAFRAQFGHQPVEGHVLVDQRRPRGPAHALQQFDESGSRLRGGCA